MTGSEDDDLLARLEASLTEGVPPSFLWPPDQPKKSHAAEPMFEPPTGGLSQAERLAAFEAEAWPDGPPAPPGWWKAAARRRARPEFDGAHAGEWSGRWAWQSWGVNGRVPRGF